MMYTSANRDEDVFADPQRFDIHRDPNPHLSFGIAEHFCLGAHLARLEGRVFFEELLATFPTIELTGEPVRVRSNLNNALKELPIRYSSAQCSSMYSSWFVSVNVLDNDLIRLRTDATVATGWRCVTTRRASGYRATRASGASEWTGDLSCHLPGHSDWSSCSTVRW